MDKSEILEGMQVMGMMGGMFVCLVFLPKEWGFWVALAFMPSLMAVQWTQGVVIKDKVNQHLALQLIVRPYKSRFFLYVKKRGAVAKYVGRGRWLTVLQLAFKANLRIDRIFDYGKVEQIALYHTGKFDSRIDPDQLLTYYWGTWVMHPSVEILEVHQDITGGVILYRGEPIPAFFMDLASGDKGSVQFVTPPYYPACTEGCPKVQELDQENTEWKSQALLFHGEAVGADLLIEQKDAETQGLLKSKGGIVDYAIEFALTLWRAFMTIDKVWRELMGPRFTWQGVIKVLAAVSVVGIAAAYLHYNPWITQTLIGYWSDPAFQVFTLLFVGVIIAGIYYISRRRRR